MNVKNKFISLVVIILILVGFSPHSKQVDAADVKVQGPVVYYKPQDIPKNIVIDGIPYTLESKVHKTGKSPCQFFKQYDFCNWVSSYPTPIMRPAM